MKTPVLRDAAVVLEPFAHRHLTRRYVSWLNDPEVVRYSEQRHRRHTLDSCRAYVDGFTGSPNHFWAIETESEGHVGNIAAMLDPPNWVADLGILLGERSLWGRGVGTAAWRLAMDWLLGPAGMRKVTAGTIAEHQSMLAVMRHVGMIEEGRRRAQVMLEGRPVDLVLMAGFAGPK